MDGPPVTLHPGSNLGWDASYSEADWNATTDARQNHIPLNHRVGWIGVESRNFPLPKFIQDHLVNGGHNTKPDRDLYICRADLTLDGHYEGLQPGKLIDNNCNVAFAEWGGALHKFQIAVWFDRPGYWAGGSDFPGPMLVAGRDNDGAPLLACSSNWVERHSLKNDEDHGRQIGKWVHGNSCEFEYADKRESPNEDVEFYHLAERPPPCPKGYEGIFPNCRPIPHVPPSNTDPNPGRTVIVFNPTGEAYDLFTTSGQFNVCTSAMHQGTLPPGSTISVHVATGEWMTFDIVFEGARNPCQESDRKEHFVVMGNNTSPVQHPIN